MAASQPRAASNHERDDIPSTQTLQPQTLRGEPVLEERAHRARVALHSPGREPPLDRQIAPEAPKQLPHRVLRHRHDWRRRPTNPSQINEQRLDRPDTHTARVTGGTTISQETPHHSQRQRTRIEALPSQPTTQMSHQLHLPTSGAPSIAPPFEFADETNPKRLKRPRHSDPQWMLTHNDPPLSTTERKGSPVSRSDPPDYAEHQPATTHPQSQPPKTRPHNPNMSINAPTFRREGP
jgi:hypothetical protein